METALEQAHFSTVFVALLRGEEGFLRAGPAYQGHMEPSPVLASSRKQRVFISQAGLHMQSGTPLGHYSLSSYSHRYPTHFMLLATEH